jgi:ABC-type nitrate/sulfonate/bicarbonate transport system permease component
VNQLLARAFGWLFFGSAWWLLCKSGVIHPIFLAPPDAVLNEILSSRSDGELLRATINTFLRTFSGFTLGVVVGITFGTVLGFAVKLRLVTEGIIDFARSIPVVILFPLFMLIFGTGDRSKVIAISWSVTPIMIVSTVFGVSAANVTRREWLVLHRVTGLRLLTACLVWELLPPLIAAMRLAFASALITCVVSEMMYGSCVGLGRYISDAGSIFATEKVYAGIVVTGVFGMIGNNILLSIQNRLINWQ